MGANAEHDRGERRIARRPGPLMEPLKHAVFDAVADVAEHFGDDLLSFVPVGSHADRDAPEELHNDYDFVYVLEGLTWERFRTLRRRLDSVAAELSRDDHLVYVDDRVGPVKPHGDTPIVSMVQPLVFDREAFARYVDTSPFITLDWSRFPVWLGHKLTYYAAIGFPTLDQLLNARAGIRHYRQMAADQTVIALTPKDDNGKLGRAVEPLPVTDDLLLELYHSIVTRTMTNALMVVAHDNSGVKRMELVDRFLEHFPRLDSHRDFAASLVDLQGRSRAGEVISFDATNAQSRAIAFLDELEARCLRP